MFFLSSKSIVLAFFLIVVGGVQLLMGWSYTEVSKREASSVGTLIHVRHGKGSSYEYVFRVNSGTYVTPLTTAGCIQGAAVLVYYDREHVTGSLLQEIGAAGREKIFLGSWMVAGGLLLIGLHFVSKRILASPDESEDTIIDKPGDIAEEIHVVPHE